MQYCVGFSFVVFCLFFWGGCFGLVLHLVFVCLFVYGGELFVLFFGVFLPLDCLQNLFSVSGMQSLDALTFHGVWLLL